MSVLTSSATATPVSPGARRTALLAGILAGPLFVTTAVVQILTRDGFDLTRHPISLLANGPYGWVQSANFVVAGLLVLVFAYAVAPQLRGGRGRVAGPVLLAVFGAGLVIGGAFKADPAMGFPAGAPAGYPDQLSTSSIIHAFAPPLSFLALVAACLVLARRFAAEGYRVAAVVTVVVAVTCFLLPLPFGPLHSVRLFVAVILGFAWVTAFALRLRAR
jgi:hypothetical membrane protein